MRSATVTPLGISAIDGVNPLISSLSGVAQALLLSDYKKI